MVCPSLARRRQAAWRGGRRLAGAILAAAALLTLSPAPSRAASAFPMEMGPCDSAIVQAERTSAIPPRLLAAIARVESGRRDAISGKLVPWPWTINAEGQGQFFATKAQAVVAVRQLQARGVRSIDVGCMQVNLMYHPAAFDSVESAFDPARNAAYAASFLTQLLGQTGSWEKATAAYHSFSPELGPNYARKVMAAWPDARAALADARPATGAPPRPTPPMGGMPGVGFADARPGLGEPPAGGGMMLSNGAERAQLIPLAPIARGRGLDDYRRAPILAVMAPRRAS